LRAIQKTYPKSLSKPPTWPNKKQPINQKTQKKGGNNGTKRKAYK
jgi:hypothetical protein